MLALLGTAFGRLLGPCWPQEPPKTFLKCIQHFHRFWDPFFIDFGRVLGGFWEPCWPPRGIENWLAILVGFFFVFLSIFTDFWGPETLILTNSPSEILVFENSLYHRFFRFLSILEAMLASKTLPKSIKNLSKKRLNIWYLFIDFSPILEASWAPYWGYVGAMLAIKPYQEPLQKIHPKKSAGLNRVRAPHGP